MEAKLPVMRCRDTEFRWGERTYVMGILNLSSDSFSGDGVGSNIDAAVAQAKRFVEDGADIIDVGGESTRPGTVPSEESIGQEIALLVPVIERLVQEISVPISVDTYKAQVARRAAEAGASMLNDIWGLKWDPSLAMVAAEYGLPLVLMSNQREDPIEGDVIAKVNADLQRGIDDAVKAGVPFENIIVDPGCGFGKSLRQNLDIVKRLSEMRSLNRPILLGTSRKSMIGLVLDLPAEERVEGTGATVALGIAGGADIVRVHDVKEMARVCRMSDAIVRG